MINHVQAVEVYLHCSNIAVQAVTLTGSLSASHWYASCSRKRKHSFFVLNLRVIPFSLLLVSKISLKPDFRVLIFVLCLFEEEKIRQEGSEQIKLVLLPPCCTSCRQKVTQRAGALHNGHQKKCTYTEILVLRDSRIASHVALHMHLYCYLSRNSCPFSEQFSRFVMFYSI